MIEKKLIVKLIFKIAVCKVLIFEPDMKNGGSWAGAFQIYLIHNNTVRLINSF